MEKEEKFAIIRNELMFEKARKLTTYLKILLTVILSAIWLLISSNFDIGIQINWIISTIFIAWISSVFFGFNTKISKERNDNQEKNNS